MPTARERVLGRADSTIRAFVKARTNVSNAQRRYDLVVVGTHGRDGIPHAVLGSVAERVVRRSARPMLVLRA